VSSFRTDADLGRLTRDTSVADIDIVVARGESSAGSNPQPNVVAASGVAKERINSSSRVAAASASGD